MKLSSLFVSCLTVNAQRPVAGSDILPTINFDDVFHVDTMKSLKNSMQGFEIVIPQNYQAIFDAFINDNPKNQIAQNARSGRSMASGGLTDQDKAFMMKYLQLKFVILYQQTNKFVGKYCFYGCWCFPQAAMFEWQGYGQPVDNIDQSCKEYTTCFNCVYNQKLLGQRCNEWDMTHYNVQGVQDPNTGRVNLFCTDPIGSCLRSRCECDRDLSLKLARYEGEWNQMNHHKWSQPLFNRQQICRDPGSVYSTAYLQAKQDGTFEVVTPHATANGGTTFQAPSSDGAKSEGNSLSINELKESTSLHAKKLYALISKQINEAEREYGEDGHVTIKIVRANASHPKSPVEAAPMYGAIIGCCGRAPLVHYFRDGQRCCPDGQVVDERAPCDGELFI